MKWSNLYPPSRSRLELPRDEKWVGGVLLEEKDHDGIELLAEEAFL